MKDDLVPHSVRSENSISTTVLERAKSGDPHAFQIISKLYAGLVYHWCRSAGLQPADVQDVSQNVFVAASRGISGFERARPEDSFRAWLRVITRSKVADFFRAIDRHAKAIGGDEKWMDAVAESFSDAESESGQINEIVLIYQKAITFIQSEFSDKDCKAFLMLIEEGHSASEVSDKLGGTTNSVYIAKSRIMKRLRDEFGELL